MNTNTKLYTLFINECEYYIEAYLTVTSDIDGDIETNVRPALDRIGDCFYMGNHVTQWVYFKPGEKLQAQLEEALETAIKEEHESDCADYLHDKQEVTY